MRPWKVITGDIHRMCVISWLINNTVGYSVFHSLETTGTKRSGGYWRYFSCRWARRISTARDFLLKKTMLEVMVFQKCKSKSKILVPHAHVLNFSAPGLEQASKQFCVCMLLGCPTARFWFSCCVASWPAFETIFFGNGARGYMLLSISQELATDG